MLSGTSTMRSAAGTMSSTLSSGTPTSKTKGQLSLPSVSPAASSLSATGAGGGAASSTTGISGTVLDGTSTAPNTHFLHPRPVPTLPWEMQYFDRRAVSHDPRIVKQVKDEKQWEGTVVQGVWQRIRLHALPHKDWLLTLEEATVFFQDCNITSPHLVQKLFQTCDLKSEGKAINGLVLCKLVELGLTLPEHQDTFVRHCFEKIDRPAAGDNITMTTLELLKVHNPNEGTGKKGKGASPRKVKATLPLYTKAGASWAMLEGLKLALRDFNTEDPNCVTFQEFKRMFLDPVNHHWVAAFTGTLFEAVAACFAPPRGKLPYLSVRWLRTTAPLPVTEDLYDADTMLLRELEKVGGEDPNAKKKKKGKGSSSPKEKKR